MQSPIVPVSGEFSESGKEIPAGGNGGGPKKNEDILTVWITSVSCFDYHRFNPLLRCCIISQLGFAVIGKRIKYLTENECDGTAF
jgi:hypothetical protein